jgi:GTP-binding protein HflX
MWGHLERIASGAGGGMGIGTRGPGETQLETDRRIVRKRISNLKADIEKIQERKSRLVAARTREHFTVCIVGYTNAGKSTLFNALTRAHVHVENRLFATLDATTRQMVNRDRELALVTDTVGFIRKLPHHLVASFHSTLVEAIEADLLLHVVDASDPEFRARITAVDGVLENLLETPRETRLVFNKVDLVTDDELLASLRAEFPDSFQVSARTGRGLDVLQHAVWAEAAARRLARAARA